MSLARGFGEGATVTAMATPSTYRELFQESLEEQIAAGGDVSRMVTLVNVYQRADQTARHFAFREWLDSASLACGRCGTSFESAPEDLQEDDDVLCVWCRKGFLGLGLEPVPGWKRTFAR